LATDGLHGVLDKAAIATLLGEGESPDVVANRLVAAALERGGADNITAVVVRCSA